MAGTAIDLDLSKVDNNVLDINDDSEEVLQALGSVAANFSGIGTCLGVRYGDMETIRKNHRGDCVGALGAVVAEWLKGNYNRKKGPQTWRKLVEVVDKRMGGNNHSLAVEIAAAHQEGDPKKAGAGRVKCSPVEETYQPQVDVTNTSAQATEPNPNIGRQFVTQQGKPSHHSESAIAPERAPQEPPQNSQSLPACMMQRNTTPGNPQRHSSCPGQQGDPVHFDLGSSTHLSQLAENRPQNQPLHSAQGYPGPGMYQTADGHQAGLQNQQTRVSHKEHGHHPPPSSRISDPHAESIQQASRDHRPQSSSQQQHDLPRPKSDSQRHENPGANQPGFVGSEQSGVYPLVQHYPPGSRMITGTGSSQFQPASSSTPNKPTHQYDPSESLTSAAVSAARQPSLATNRSHQPAPQHGYVSPQPTSVESQQPMSRPEEAPHKIVHGEINYSPKEQRGKDDPDSPLDVQPRERTAGRTTFPGPLGTRQHSTSPGPRGQPSGNTPGATRPRSASPKRQPLPQSQTSGQTHVDTRTISSSSTHPQDRQNYYRPPASEPVPRRGVPPSQPMAPTLQVSEMTSGLPSSGQIPDQNEKTFDKTGYPASKFAGDPPVANLSHGLSKMTVGQTNSPLTTSSQQTVQKQPLKTPQHDPVNQLNQSETRANRFEGVTHPPAGQPEVQNSSRQPGPSVVGLPKNPSQPKSDDPGRLSGQDNLPTWNPPVSQVTPIANQPPRTSSGARFNSRDTSLATLNSSGASELTLSTLSDPNSSSYSTFEGSSFDEDSLTFPSMFGTGLPSSDSNRATLPPEIRTCIVSKGSNPKHLEQPEYPSSITKYDQEGLVGTEDGDDQEGSSLPFDSVQTDPMSHSADNAPSTTNSGYPADNAPSTVSDPSLDPRPLIVGSPTVVHPPVNPPACTQPSSMGSIFGQPPPSIIKRPAGHPSIAPSEQDVDRLNFGVGENKSGPSSFGTKKLNPKAPPFVPQFAPAGPPGPSSQPGSIIQPGPIAQPSSANHTQELTRSVPNVRPSEQSVGTPSNVAGSSHHQQETPQASGGEMVISYRDRPLLKGYVKQSRTTADGENIDFLTFEAYNRKEAKKCVNIKLSFQDLVYPETEERMVSMLMKVYEMKKFPHGVAVIINNEKFKNSKKHKEREGTMVDEENLIITFRYLGYNVEVHRNRNVDQMCEIFEEIKGRDHSNYDSFVCCILSHGEGGGKIVGADSHAVMIESLTERLCADNCPQLREKPKLFFIQACRGKMKCRVASDGQGGNSSEEEEADFPTGLTTQDSEDDELHSLMKSLPSIESRVEADSEIPRISDFFFGYATPSGHVAWRDLDHGSWYVSELCRALCRYSRSLSLDDIMNEVHMEVGSSVDYKYNNYKQAPETTSRLCKKVFF